MIFSVDSSAFRRILIAVEYQKFNFGTRAGAVGVPRDHRFNLSFTLAGIGTFSDLFGAFGGQQGR